MFIGAINQKVRSFLALSGQVFDGRTVVVGCSGNFSAEAVIAHAATPLAVHSNDVSLYSCLAGSYLRRETMPLAVVEPAYEWLKPYLSATDSAMAAVMVLLEMLPYEKIDRQHRQRMWPLYRDGFAELVEQTQDKLGDVRIGLTSFYAGDVFEHFNTHEHDEAAIFCCYAPTYAGGYERLYKRLEQIIKWPAPTYARLDNKRRDELLRWIAQRDYVWYDDRRHADLPLVMEHRSGRGRTLYVYSNLATMKAFVRRLTVDDPPKLPLATKEMVLTGKESVRLAAMDIAQMSAIKDMLLGKNIDHGRGSWAYAVWLGDWVVGFLEFREDPATRTIVHLFGDLAVPGTSYKRLSKLMPMLAISGESKRLVQRLQEYPTHLLKTTAFTERPVSMKYRGVLELVRRGKSESGQKTLSYQSGFNTLSWQETYNAWMSKHA